MKGKIIALAGLVLVAALGVWWWVGENPPTHFESPEPAAQDTPPGTPLPASAPVPAPASPSSPPTATPAPPAAVPAPPAVPPEARTVPATPAVSLPVPKPAAPTLPVSPAAPAMQPPAAAPGVTSDVPPPPIDPDLEAKVAIEVDAVDLMLRDYRTRMGENPVGTNAEIMKAVMGGNPKQARLGPPEGQRLNANGELVDRWGTPYFFHQLSRTNTEVRSAGPDKVLWTEDDILAR